MKIPKRFQLLGYTYRVEIVPEAEWPDDSTYGYCSPQLSKIQIRQQACPEAMEHTFFHELMHAILGAMSREKLNKDEGFVDTAGGLLHQAMKTAKFD